MMSAMPVIELSRHHVASLRDLGARLIDSELAVPHLRETIIANARALCEARYHGAFDKIAAQLDERGLHVVKQPRVPLDAMQAVQRVLFDVRAALFDRVARAAIDRAK